MSGVRYESCKFCKNKVKHCSKTPVSIDLQHQANLRLDPKGLKGLNCMARDGIDCQI